MTSDKRGKMIEASCQKEVHIATDRVVLGDGQCLFRWRPREMLYSSGEDIENLGEAQESFRGEAFRKALGKGWICVRYVTWNGQDPVISL